MRIFNVRPIAGRPVVATFDIEFAPGIRIYDAYLRRNAAGELRLFTPQAGDKRIVTFDIALSDSIIETAVAAARSQMAHGINTAN